MLNETKGLLDSLNPMSRSEVILGSGLENYIGMLRHETGLKYKMLGGR